MPTNLEGRVALVTGASRGIGASCARALARQGATVALAARSKDLLTDLANEIGAGARGFEVDLSKPGASQELVAAVTRTFGEIRILVNNAGVSLSKPIEKFAEDDYENVFNTNVRATISLCASAVSSMQRGGNGGAVVNISSVAGLSGTPYLSIYGASKAAIDGFTRSLACEVGPQNIRVNAVLPGFIVTDMWERGRQIPGLADSVEQRIALRRWGTPEDIADAVVFLCSDAARYVTGTSLIVDGGFAQMAEVLPRR